MYSKPSCLNLSLSRSVNRYFAACSGVEGYPASVVALTSSLALVFASSKVTTACFLSKFTATLATPDTRFNAFLTVIGQVSQVMPGTSNVTVLVAAQIGVDIAPI